MVRRKHVRRPVFGLICLAIFLVPSGCFLPLRDGPIRTESRQSERESYAAAVDFYVTSDYTKSANMFESIQDQTTDPATSRMALYGLACARLMLADSPEAYREAMALWDQWVQCAPQQLEYENPILFAPVVKEKMFFSHIPLDGEGETESKDADADGWPLIRANRELQRARGQLEEAGKNIEARDKKIRALEKEISRLNEQINAFETIDQKIQKKKNAIPSAD